MYEVSQYEPRASVRVDGSLSGTAEKAGKISAASDMVASLIADLVQFGLSSADLRTLCDNVMKVQAGEELVEHITRRANKQPQPYLIRAAS